MKFREPKMVFLPEGVGGMIPNTTSIETEYVNNSLLPIFSSSSSPPSSGFYDNDDDDWATNVECHSPRGPPMTRAVVGYKIIEKEEKEKESRNPNDDRRSVVTNGTDEAVVGYEVMEKEKKKKKKKKSSKLNGNHRGRSVVTNDIDEEWEKMVRQNEFWEQFQICETQSSRDNNNNNSYGRQLSALVVPRSENKKDTSSLSTRRDSTVRTSILPPLLSPRPTRVVKSSCCKPERVREDDGNKNEKEETLDDEMTSTTVTETIEVIAPPFHRRSRSWRVGTWKLSREQTKKEQQKEERR